MFDQVTLGLNVDPLILGALKEDITSEDVSTNSVMRTPTKGEVDLIAKEDGIICGVRENLHPFGWGYQSRVLRSGWGFGEKGPAHGKGHRRYPCAFKW